MNSKEKVKLKYTDDIYSIKSLVLKYGWLPALRKKMYNLRKKSGI